MNVTDLLALPGDGDEVGRVPVPSEDVWCEACGAALPLDAPAEAHDHDFAGPITRYHPDGTVEEVDV